jgi:hypothetical protein
MNMVAESREGSGTECLLRREQEQIAGFPLSREQEQVAGCQLGRKQNGKQKGWNVESVSTRTG